MPTTAPAASSIDTPPELRLQLLAASVDRIDAVWFTHGHADHMHGIDDLRVFSLAARRRLLALRRCRLRERSAPTGSTTSSTTIMRPTGRARSATSCSCATIRRMSASRRRRLPS